MREKKYSATSKQIGMYLEQLLNIEDDKELSFVLSEAIKKGTPPLQMTPMDGRHLEVLARAVNAQKIIEIGTLCGYSTVCLSRALKEGGLIYTCERSEHHANVARGIFKELKLENKIELIFGEALESLKTLETKGPFDLVFIDADKENYPNYFDWAVTNLRSGGVLVADNVFAFDHIADFPLPEGKLGELVQAMLHFNEKCVKNKNLVSTFFPTGEGLMVAYKK